MAELEIRELTEAEQSCLKCTLFAPVCDGNDKGCRYVQIVRSPSVRSSKQMSAWHTPESRAKAAAKTSETRRTAGGWLRNENGEWIAKPCNKCGQLLPLSAFYKQGCSLSTKCKSCLKRSAAVATSGSK